MPAARPTPAHQIPAFGQQHQQQQKSGQQPAAPPGLLPTSSSSQTQPAQPQRVRKRVKQAAGAGTVLLALFSFVVFMGPLGPLQRFAPAPQDFAHSLSAETTAGELHSSGRVLMSLPSGSEHVPVVLNETQLQLLHDSRLPKNGVVPLMEGSGENDVATPGRPGAETWLQGQGWWSDGPDHAPFDSPKSIMLKPSDKAAEQQALQGLKASHNLLVLLIENSIPARKQEAIDYILKQLVPSFCATCCLVIFGFHLSLT